MKSSTRDMPTSATHMLFDFALVTTTSGENYQCNLWINFVNSIHYAAK
jgi:hypothetical protein